MSGVDSFRAWRERRLARPYRPPTWWQFAIPLFVLCPAALVVTRYGLHLPWPGAVIYSVVVPAIVWVFQYRRIWR